MFSKVLAVSEFVQCRTTHGTMLHSYSLQSVSLNGLQFAIFEVYNWCLAMSTDFFSFTSDWFL